MERLTTDNPRNNTEAALNLVYVKDGQAWVRNGGPYPGYPDVALYDYMRLIVADHGPMSIKAGLTDDELGDALGDALFDGIETKEGLCAMLYTLAWALAELRQRLAAYEDTGLEPEAIKSFVAECKVNLADLDSHRKAKKTKTNADKIRQMSDEEIVNLFLKFDVCNQMSFSECSLHNCNCESCILDWLKQEVESDG